MSGFALLALSIAFVMLAWDALAVRSRMRQLVRQHDMLAEDVVALRDVVTRLAETTKKVARQQVIMQDNIHGLRQSVADGRNEVATLLAMFERKY